MSSLWTESRHRSRSLRRMRRNQIREELINAAARSRSKSKGKVRKRGAKRNRSAAPSPSRVGGSHELEFEIVEFKALELQPTTSQAILYDVIKKSRYSMENAEMIGEGSFGDVYRVKVSSNLSEVAIKIVEFSEEVLGELLAMRHLRHPNLIEILDVLTGPLYKNGARFLGIVMPLAKTNLYSLMRENTEVIDFSTRLRIARDCICGLQFMHESGFVHLDLKAHNVLIMEDGRACIADMGLSRMADFPLENPNSIVTIDHRAPELLSGEHKYDSFAVDLWALGIVLLKLFVGYWKTDIKPFVSSFASKAQIKNAYLQQEEIQFVLLCHLFFICPEIRRLGIKKFKDTYPALDWFSEWESENFKSLDQQLDREAEAFEYRFPGTSIKMRRWIAGCSPTGQISRLDLLAKQKEWREIDELIGGFVSLDPLERTDLASALQNPAFQNNRLCRETAMASNQKCAACPTSVPKKFEVELENARKSIGPSVNWKSIEFRNLLASMRLSESESEKPFHNRVYGTYLILKNNVDKNQGLRKMLDYASSEFQKELMKQCTLDKNDVDPAALRDIYESTALVTLVFMFYRASFFYVGSSTKKYYFHNGSKVMATQLNYLKETIGPETTRELIDVASFMVLSGSLNRAISIVGHAFDWDAEKMFTL